MSQEQFGDGAQRFSHPGLVFLSRAAKNKVCVGGGVWWALEGGWKLRDDRVSRHV